MPDKSQKMTGQRPPSVVDLPCDIASQDSFLGFCPIVLGLRLDSPMKSVAVVLGAGGLVFNAKTEVLLIQYPLARGGGWSFPKGHIEKDETPEVAAVREVLEEGGVRATTVASLEPTRYVNPRGVSREIFWFAMRTSDLQATPEPGFQAGFYDPTEAIKLLSHAENRDLLESARLVLR
jgi:diadenosine hexaphosphate hydrolase (ATP-forming)